MNRFTTGLLFGGVATMAGIAYLMQDQKAYRKVMKNGRKMAVKAEEVIDDMMDDLVDR